MVYISILFLFVFVFFIYFFYKKNCQYNVDVVFDFADIDYKFFYFKDLQNKKEYISSELKKLLNIQNKDNSFDNLLVALREDNKENLENFYSKLDEAQKNESEKLYEIDWALKINLKDDSNDQGVKYMSCQYMVLKDKKGYAKSFFIFFADITRDRVKVDRLKENNKKLQSDLQLIKSSLDKIDVPIWVKNQNDDITYKNSACDNFLQSGKYIDEDDNEENTSNYSIKKYNNEDNSTCYIALDQRKIKEYEDESKRYLASLSKLLEVSSNAFAIYDADRNLKFYNPSFLKMWDLDADSISKGMTYEEILDELKSRRIFPEDINYKSFKAERISFFQELLMPHSDFLFLPDGRVIRVVIVQHAFGGLIFCYEDMTDKYHFKSSYQTQSAVQQKTINSLSDGVIVFSENGKVAILNPQIKKMWGLRKLAKNFHFKDFFEYVKSKIEDNIYQKFEDNFFKCFNHQKSSELNLETKDRKIFSMKMMSLPDGATLLNTKDITEATLFERSMTEKNIALEKVDKLKTDFLNNVSYELRSPLTSIKGYAEILSYQYAGELNEKQKNYMRAITESSDTLLDIINDIIDLASIEAGHISLNKKQNDCKTMLHESLVDFKGRYKLVDNFAKVEVFCDKDRLVHAIKKFIQFVTEFSDLEKGVDIEYTESKSYVEISLENIYLKDYEIVKIVKDKFMENISAMTLKPSINSGLSVLQTIIDLHSGRIHFHSDKNVISIKILLPKKNSL